MKEITLPNNPSDFLKELVENLKKMNVSLSTKPNRSSIGIVESEAQYLELRKTTVGQIVWISESPQTVRPDTTVISRKDPEYLKFFIADLAYNSK
jgi:hypothetical protein